MYNINSLTVVLTGIVCPLRCECLKFGGRFPGSGVGVCSSEVRVVIRWTAGTGHYPYPFHSANGLASVCKGLPAAFQMDPIVVQPPVAHKRAR